MIRGRAASRSSAFLEHRGSASARERRSVLASCRACSARLGSWPRLEFGHWEEHAFYVAVNADFPTCNQDEFIDQLQAQWASRRSRVPMRKEAWTWPRPHRPRRFGRWSRKPQSTNESFAKQAYTSNESRSLWSPCVRFTGVARTDGIVSSMHCVSAERPEAEPFAPGRAACSAAFRRDVHALLNFCPIGPGELAGGLWRNFWVASESLLFVLSHEAAAQNPSSPGLLGREGGSCGGWACPDALVGWADTQPRPQG